MEKDFFKQASGLFLTEALTYDEFDEILERGECLPVTEDYEGWDVDHLENAISMFAEELEEAYNQGVADGILRDE